MVLWINSIIPKIIIFKINFGREENKLWEFPWKRHDTAKAFLEKLLAVLLAWFP